MTATSELDDSFHVFDTTLRDGAQREGINLTVADKLTIARHLDDFGVGFIEGGWPGANPRDTEFFARAQPGDRLQARPARRLRRHPPGGRQGRGGPAGQGAPGLRRPGDHPGRQVARPACRAGPAHHAGGEPGDGPRHRLPPASRRAAGSSSTASTSSTATAPTPSTPRPSSGPRTRPAPTSSSSATPTAACSRPRSRPSSRTVLADTGARLGIHAQDDTGCAVANTLAAVDAGATHVQCTANGYGERVGNANLFPVVAALELKYGKKVLPEGALARDDPHLARHRRGRQPHALHPPALRRRLRLRPQGRACTPPRSRSTRTCTSTSTPSRSATPCGCWSPTWRAAPPSSSRARSSASTSAATASWSAGSSSGSRSASSRATRTRPPTPPSSCCCATRSRAGPARYFRVESWRAIVEDRPDGTHANEATVKLWAKGERIVATAEGNGPVNALDRALRVGLERIYPQLAKLELVDYKVRILEGKHGTESTTRVLISTTRRHGRVVHGRRRRERHRRVLAGPGGRVHLRAAAGRRRAGRVARTRPGPPDRRSGPRSRRARPLLQVPLLVARPPCTSRSGPGPRSPTTARSRRGTCSPPVLTTSPVGGVVRPLLRSRCRCSRTAGPSRRWPSSPTSTSRHLPSARTGAVGLHGPLLAAPPVQS